LHVRTFIFSDDKASKLWNIEQQGKQLRTTADPAGTTGKTQARTLSSAARAKAAVNQLVEEKLSEGYVETTPSFPPETTERVLERALLESPDDDAAYAAFADRLNELDDPRGEFAQVQLRLEDAGVPAKQRAALHKREKALLKEHGRQWLGELAPFLLDQQGVPEHQAQSGDGNRFQFRRGWLDSVHIPFLDADLARALGRAPQTRLLRNLVILGWDDIVDHIHDEDFDPEQFLNPDPEQYPGPAPLAQSASLGNVRMLQLGNQYALEEQCYEYYIAGYRDLRRDLLSLVRRMPRLEALYLENEFFGVEELFSLKTLTHLKALQLCFGANYPLEALAANRSLQRLSYLLLHPQAIIHNPERPFITLQGVQALLHSPNLPSLTHLRLHQTTVGDRGCEEIVQSGILQRLKVLDLGFGSITDAGARTLAACPDLRNLELLDLYNNALTKRGVKALEAVGIRVHTDYQHNAGDDHYLYEGSFE
jgi:uncharacterized protein (TIGR02996 family)